MEALKTGLVKVEAKTFDKAVARMQSDSHIELLQTKLQDYVLEIAI